MMRLVAAALVIAAFLVGSPPSQAQLRPSGPLANCFSALEQTAVFSYYGVKRQPSSRCRTAKGTPLPAGAGEADLPEDLTIHLPPLPEGRRRVIVGKSVMLLDSQTRAILDVIPDVVRKPKP